MNFQTTMNIPVIPVSKPTERTWEIEDKQTGQKRTGSVHVMRALMIPSNPEADPSSIKEVELNINTSKTSLGCKKNISDMVELYFENKSKFDNGEAYLNVETYMGPRMNKGVVTFFSPWVNDATIVQANDESNPYIKAVRRKEEQL